MNLTEFIDHFGVPFAVLFFIGWFLLRHLWPFIKEQIVTGQAAAAQERQQFVAALKEFLALASDQHAHAIELHHEMTRQLEHLARAVTEVALVVRELKHTAQTTSIKKPHV